MSKYINNFLIANKKKKLKVHSNIQKFEHKIVYTEYRICQHNVTQACIKSKSREELFLIFLITFGCYLKISSNRC